MVKILGIWEHVEFKRSERACLTWGGMGTGLEGLKLKWINVISWSDLKCLNIKVVSVDYEESSMYWFIWAKCKSMYLSDKKVYENGITKRLKDN